MWINGFFLFKKDRRDSYIIELHFEFYSNYEQKSFEKFFRRRFDDTTYHPEYIADGVKEIYVSLSIGEASNIEEKLYMINNLVSEFEKYTKIGTEQIELAERIFDLKMNDDHLCH